jgi:hypothetical protein
MQFMMLPSLRSASIALLSLIPMKVFQAIPSMRKVSLATNVKNIRIDS